jgi:mannose/cellobiose epimerase-like protein (N-acyl-D-glucosamine 2-epimerase family)
VVSRRRHVLRGDGQTRYWHGKQDGAIRRATKNGFTTHFGSLAFAGLVMWFVNQAKNAVRRAGDAAVPRACARSTAVCAFACASVMSGP